MSADLQADFTNLTDAGNLAAPRAETSEKRQQQEPSHGGPGTTSSLVKAVNGDFFEATVRCERLTRQKDPGTALENALCGIHDLQKDCIRYPNDPERKIQINQILTLAADTLSTAWKTSLTHPDQTDSLASAARDAEKILSNIDTVLKSEGFTTFRGRESLSSGIGLVISGLKDSLSSPATSPKSTPDPAP